MISTAWGFPLAVGTAILFLCVEQVGKSNPTGFEERMTAVQLWRHKSSLHCIAQKCNQFPILTTLYPHCSGSADGYDSILHEKSCNLLLLKELQHFNGQNALLDCSGS